MERWWKSSTYRDPKVIIPLFTILGLYNAYKSVLDFF